MKERHSELAYWSDMALTIEKSRVAVQVGLTHLKKLHRESPEREEFLKLIIPVEAFVDGILAREITTHPTWPWASRSKGVGKENLPKVVGLIEAFGRYYDQGDPLIPAYVNRPLEKYYKIEKVKNEEAGEIARETVEKEGIWVEGIERLTNVSKLFKYAGLDPGAKRQAGSIISFNSDLRMALFRLQTGLNRAGGIWYTGSSESGCSPGYLGYRVKIVERKPGIQVVPTPKGRMCFICNIEVKGKDTHYCPKCEGKLSFKTEPEGYLYKGHLHFMALRETEKDFCLCLWLVWRQALGLPVTQPWDVVKLGHPAIDPWKMVDR